jgi:hypothetical protein
MAALFLRRELILEVNAGSSRFDIGFHNLKGAKGATEPGFGISNDRSKPVSLSSALHTLNLIRALQRAIYSATKLRSGIARV